MSKNHSKIACRDLFIKALDFDLIDMNPLHKENRPLPKSPLVNNFFISKKEYLDSKSGSVENIFIAKQRKLIKSNSYNLYNSFKNDLDVSFGDIIKIGDKKFLVESYNPYNKLYKLLNLITFKKHFFDLKSINHYIILTHDIKFDIETFEKIQLKRVNNISKNLFKRKSLIKEKIKKYEYTLLDTNSDSEYSSDWEDDISLPPFEEDDDYFDFEKDFVYNPEKPKLDFSNNVFSNMEKGKLYQNKSSDPFEFFFNKKESKTTNKKKDIEVDSKIIDPEEIDYESEIDEFLEKEPIILPEKSLILPEKPIDKYNFITNKNNAPVNIFDDNVAFKGYNNLWNFNNKINLDNDYNDDNIVFTAPINLFNMPIVSEYKPKNMKPTVDMITPIINHIKNNKEPKPYAKNLLEDIKIENIPDAYNKSISKEKLAPIYNIDKKTVPKEKLAHINNIDKKTVSKEKLAPIYNINNNYFSTINNENIKNLDLLSKIEPKIVTVENDIPTLKEDNNETDVDNKNNLNNEEQNSWASYCVVM